MARPGSGRAALTTLPPSAFPRWTQTDISALRQALGAGQPAADLAAALGREPADVSAMMGRLRLREATISRR